jgi:hypothetical protein
MRYVIWFNGNNWESKEFMEVYDAEEFVGSLEEQNFNYTWFITTEIGKEILIDKGVVYL